MSIPSNLYAEKIFAEHPVGLWPLDETLDYITLISEANRNFSQWTLSNATASSTYTVTDQPFETSIVNLLTGSVPSLSTEEIKCIGPDLVNFNDLDSEIKTFCISSYVYSVGPYMQSISIGYEYTDTTTSTVIQHLKTFDTSVTGQWFNISETFQIPDENTTLRPVIKIIVGSGGSSGDYNFKINGISIGQGSENFNAKSLGITPLNISGTLAVDSDYAVIANPYGVSSSYGYYLSDQYSLRATNTSIPVVYGANNITRIKPNNNKPSLIIPGKGFLNKVGQHKTYTLEFWMRLECNSYTSKKIVGPISSDDGLYVEGAFLTLLINNKFKSYFVGEWFRPMLVQLVLIRNNASVLINGEQVITLDIDTDNLILPEEYDGAISQDWIGFYSYNNVSPFEIDCVAIYPYQVSNIVAKRRFAYGQAVLSQENIDSSYGGSSIAIDYPSADYTANYNYPSFAQWQQGSFDNVITTSNSLSMPQYELPQIYIDSKTLDELYSDNLAIQDINDDSFISFRPNSNWNSQLCYFNINNFNIINDEIHSIYGVFSSSNLLSQEVLIKVYNSINGNYFIIKKDLNTIKYVLNYNGVDQVLYTTSQITSGNKFSVGFKIQKLVDTFGGNTSAFFGNKNGLKIYISGDENLSNQFTGKLYSFGICSSYSASQIQDYIDDDGFILISSSTELLGNTATYTLLPLEKYNTFYLDIGAYGYWEDYLPLSYFGQYVTDSNGDQYYDLDFLQFNIGYPSPSMADEKETISSWSYSDLLESYSHPLQRQYSDLDNSLFTLWNNYEDMEQKSIKYYEYNTDEASIRTFLTFQYIDQGANAPESYFTYKQSVNQNRVINIDDYENWDTTMFEIVDNTIVYPSKKIDFNKIALVYHLDFNIRGILTKPLNLRKLEIASQAFNNNSFNPIGTKFGNNIFPYTKSGIYYDYKSNNPFSIYKGSTPYLYLSRTSGVEIRGNYDPLVDRGISLPINSTLSDNYRMSAAQIWMYYEKEQFPLTEIKIFEIKYKADTILFYLSANDSTGKRAKIYAKSLLTGQTFNGISYYWNGILTREPTINIKEWGVLGISFGQSLVFDSYMGSINLSGLMLFNNISYYQANNLQQIQSVLTRPWLKVKSDGVINYEWSYWANNYIWDGVLILSSSDLYGIDPSNTYKAYTGTNKIIVDDNTGIMVSSNKLKIYEDTTWSVKVGTPV